MSTYYTYIAFDNKNTLLHIGVTRNLFRRFKLFRLKYHTNCKLAYYEEFSNSKEATQRENELLQLHEIVIKELVNNSNPMFIDLNIENKQ